VAGDDECAHRYYYNVYVLLYTHIIHIYSWRHAHDDDDDDEPQHFPRTYNMTRAAPEEETRRVYIVYNIIYYNIIVCVCVCIRRCGWRDEERKPNRNNVCTCVCVCVSARWLEFAFEKKRKKRNIPPSPPPHSLALPPQYCEEPILARILYYIDDTVIVHHGETCPVRLFVLFRETAFSPVPPSPPQHRS